MLKFYKRRSLLIWMHTKYFHKHAYTQNVFTHIWTQTTKFSWSQLIYCNNLLLRSFLKKKIRLYNTNTIESNDIKKQLIIHLLILFSYGLVLFVKQHTNVYENKYEVNTDTWVIKNSFSPFMIVHCVCHVFFSNCWGVIFWSPWEHY